MRTLKKATASICFTACLTVFSMAIGCQSELSKQADEAIIHREKMRKIDAQIDAASQKANMEMDAAARRLGH